MSAKDLIVALALPESCWVNQRVPKKLLVENGAPSTSDKREINDGIDEVHWLAALKPNTIGVPEFRDEEREYLEIAVLSVTLRGNAKAARLAELTHRAVPYPLLLLLISGQEITLSLAHKRWAQNDPEKVVLDGALEEVRFTGETSPVIESAFMQALALSVQSQTSLYALYQSWMDQLQALLAARLTGVFKGVETAEQTAARRQALRDCQRLKIEAAEIRTKAAKEKQVARQVELNSEFKRIQLALAAAYEQL